MIGSEGDTGSMKFTIDEAALPSITSWEAHTGGTK